MTGPSRIGRYEIERELGRGAMGLVFLAHDPRIDRKVAVKTIQRNDSLPEAEEEESRQRFLREAQAAGKLIHPGIVTIFDVGEDQGTSYIAMEYIQGETLEAVTKPGNLLPVEKALQLISQACHALDYAHQHRIVHRDIKPANLMVVADRQLKIMDFGLAKNPSANLTSAGTLIGTPNYMSPEQIMGKPLDGRSDLFSLGVVLYELLSGERPFGGDTISTIIYKVLHEEPKRPDAVNPDIPAPLSRIVLKAIDKDPAKRFQKGEELATDLASYLGSLSSTPDVSPIEDGSQAAPVKPRPAAPPPRERKAAVAPPPPRRSALIPILAVLVLLIGSAAGAYFFVPAVRQEADRLLARAGLAAPAADPATGGGEAGQEAGGQADAGEQDSLPGPAVDLPPPPPQGETLSVAVATDPPGGQIYLDDRPIGGDSLLLAKDDKAVHTLVAENDCFVDSISFRAGEADSVTIPLKTPRLHTLRVTSEPTGARIVLDGKSAGTTPADVNVALCKEHKFQLRKGGYRTVTEEFGAGTVWADVSMDIALERLPDGRVAVKAPYSIGILEGGRSVGSSKSPAKLPAGSHKLTFVNRDLFVSITRTVEVQPDKTITPSIKFPGTGEITVHANPSNGTVFIDGREIGSPPILARPLAEGTYQVRYELESGQSKVETALVIAGQPKLVKFKMK